MTKQYHPLIKQLLDGELSPAALPPELRAEGDEALHVLAAVDRAPVGLSAELEQRVMGQVLRHARSPIRRAWRWVVGARDRGGRLGRPTVPRRRVRTGRGGAGPMRPVGLGALLAGAGAGRVRAGGDVAGGFGGRVPPAVVAAVRQLAENAAARGLRVEPLVDK